MIEITAHTRLPILIAVFLTVALTNCAAFASSTVITDFRFGIATGNAKAIRVPYKHCALGDVVLTGGKEAFGVVADGSLLSISRYPDLYSLIGTRYGGNGTTTFGIPDLRSATPNGLTYTICTEGIHPRAFEPR